MYSKYMSNLMLMHEYKHVISMGESCVPAVRLSMKNFRHESYLFDWASSNPEIIAQIIEMGSIDFLLKDKTRNTWPTHSAYVNPNLHWPHRDLNKEEDIAYLKRCEHRLFSILKSDQPVLFLHVVPIHKQSNYNGIVILRDTIVKRFPHLCFLIASVEALVNNNIKRSLLMSKTIDNVIFYRMCVHDKWEGEGDKWVGSADNDIWEAFWSQFKIKTIKSKVESLED